jgi:hypothetical protein
MNAILTITAPTGILCTTYLITQDHGWGAAAVGVMTFFLCAMFIGARERQQSKPKPEPTYATRN